MNDSYYHTLVDKMETFTQLGITMQYDGKTQDKDISFDKMLEYVNSHSQEYIRDFVKQRFDEHIAWHTR